MLVCFKGLLPANHAKVRVLDVFDGRECGVGDGGPDPPRMFIVAVMSSDGALMALEVGGCATIVGGGGGRALMAVSKGCGICVAIGMGAGLERS